MSTKQGNKNKDLFLGMSHGTASNQLRKMLLFDLVKKCGLDMCYRCGERIENIEDLSIEHKKAWLGVDVKLFWDLDNIAYSHLKCNIGEGRREERSALHGTFSRYTRPGCRCEECTKANAKHRREWKNKNKLV